MSILQEELGPFQKQAAYKLSGTKSGLFGLKEFQELGSDKIVLVATNNTTVVSYINKERNVKSGSLVHFYGGS